MAGTQSKTATATVSVRKGPKQKSTPAVKAVAAAGVTTRGQGRPPKAAGSGPTQKMDINVALRKIKSLNKKYSKDDKETEEEDILGQPTPKGRKLGELGQHLPIIAGRPSFVCAICNLKHKDKNDFADDDHWVFCPMCKVLYMPCVSR